MKDLRPLAGLSFIIRAIFRHADFFLWEIIRVFSKPIVLSEVR
jgi:hypothetical protein